MSVVLLLAADAFSFLSSSSSFQYNKIFSAPAVNSQFYSSHDHITTATHIPIIGSFTSAVNSKTKKKNPTKLRVALRSSSTTENEKDNTEISTASIKEKQDFVKEALLKLIERQQRELEDTKTLLHKLEREGNDLITMNNDTKATVTTTNSTSIRSSSSLFSDGISTIAASIFSGADYGFQSRSEGCRFGNILTKSNPLFDGYGPPANIISLATQQFQRNLDAIRGDYKDEKEIGLSKNQKLLQAKLKQLTLNSTAIWERERSRGPINAPIVVKVPYFILCYFLDVLFEGRYIPSRFFLLETVARMPYFSYISMLHLYETLGWWRRSADVKRVHFAEEWNEYHHLLIMESLGGDQQWSVRFLAQHSAIAYYWGLIALFATSPSLSYKFSELLETHAVDTYGQFLDENEVLLKELPPSFPAVDYYSIGITDPLFGEYQTSSLKNDESVRKPGLDMRNLYDVFNAIKSDEGDHVETMKACLDDKTVVLSPSLESRTLIGLTLTALVGYVAATNGGDFGDSLSNLGSDFDSMGGDVMVDGGEGLNPFEEITFGIFALIQALKESLGDDAEAAINKEDIFSSLIPLLNSTKKLLISFLEILIKFIR